MDKDPNYPGVVQASEANARHLERFLELLKNNTLTRAEFVTIASQVKVNNAYIAETLDEFAALLPAIWL